MGASQFYRWFIKFRMAEGDPSELSKALIDNASRKFRVQKNKAYPWTERSEELGLSLCETVQKLNRTPRTIRKLMKPDGNIRSQLRQGGPIGIQSENIDRLSETLAGSISLAKVTEVLGVGTRTAEILRDANILPFSFPRDTDSRIFRNMIRRSLLERWVKGIVGEPSLLEEMPPNTILLRNTPIITKVPVLALLSAVRDGRIPVIGRLCGMPPFGGAVLSRDLVMASMPPSVRKKLAYWTNKRRPRRPSKTIVSEPAAARAEPN